MDDTRRLSRFMLAFVVIAAAMSAGLAFAQFWPNSDHLFSDMTHDRNAHYYQGLSMALNLKNGDVAGFVHDIDSCRVWGILHPAVIAAIQFIAGPNVKLGVLPSVCGWFGAAVFAFLLAGRACSNAGAWAGVCAAALVLASPAHRAYATDIMLESSGACLTLAALYAYLVWVQNPSGRSATWLAIAASLLFFEKYNYWLLVVSALAANEACRQPQLLVTAWSWLRANGLRFGLAQLRHPLTIFALLIGAAGLAIAVTGGTSWTWRAREISMRTPHNFVHVAYLLLFVRLLIWWVRVGQHESASWPDNYRPLVFGHFVPIVLWFALPKRLFYFFWYLSPANADQSNHGFLPGLGPYWAALEGDYHVSPPWLLIVLAFFGCAVIAIRNLRPGAAALLWFVLFSALLTFQHPMSKNRFLHSWVACVWVAAAIGLMQAVRMIFKPWPRAATSACGIAATLLVAALGDAFFQPGRAQEGGPRLDRPSTLCLSRTYLPSLQQARNVAILCNVQTSFELRWSYLEAFRRARGITTNIKGYDPKSDTANKVVADWLAAASHDAIVVIDVPQSSPFHPRWPVDVGPIQRELENQSVYTLSHSWRLEHDESIQFWSRTSAATLVSK